MTTHPLVAVLVLIRTIRAKIQVPSTDHQTHPISIINPNIMLPNIMPRNTINTINNSNNIIRINNISRFSHSTLRRLPHSYLFNRIFAVRDNHLEVAAPDLELDQGLGCLLEQIALVHRMRLGCTRT
jgi:hypothetical protein